MRQMTDAEHPCRACGQKVRPRQQALQCDACSGWHHRVCTSITRQTYRELCKIESLPWYCCSCQVPDFSTGSSSSCNLSASLQDLQPVGKSTQLSEATVDFHRVADERIPIETDPVSVSTSFDVSAPLDPVQQYLEISMLTHDPAEERVTYRILPTGSQRGGPLLVDSRGNSYNKKPSDKRHKSTRTVWTCSRRKKGLCCLAKVYQEGDTFLPGVEEHLHKAEPGRDKKLEIVAEVKKAAEDQVFMSASAITENVLMQRAGDYLVPGCIPKLSNVIRQANRHRRKNRPYHPRNQHRTLRDKHIPDGFLLDDSSVGLARHLVQVGPDDASSLVRSGMLVYQIFR